MRGRDFRSLRVQQKASMLLAARRLPNEPPWYATISDYPPSTETAVRTLPVQHEQEWQPGNFSKPAPVRSRNKTPNTRSARRPRKASRMFAPLHITYEEDALRQDFFRDHPWELARPRQVLEDDGKDYQRWDWSKAHEPGRPISGESVIQRQLHLLHGKQSKSANNASEQQQHTKESAYDQARKEHYDLRHEAEIETRIAREEALAVGASFGRTANDIGMQLEKAEFERWKAWAEAQVTVQEQARSAAYTGGGDGAGGEDEPGEDGLASTIDQLGSSAAVGRAEGRQKKS